MPATSEALGNLHDLVTQELTRRIESGKATAADIAQAIKLLKDNGITAAGVTQIYCPYSGFSGLFIRSYYNDSGWSPWREVYHSGNLGAATESSAGLIKIATADEAQALTSDVVALTPARLADAFKGANQSLSGNGYQRLPGGLIIQWGESEAVNTSANQKNPVTFPISFTSTSFPPKIFVNHIGAVSWVNVIVDQNSYPLLNGFSWSSDYTGGFMRIFWFAIGY